MDFIDNNMNKIKIKKTKMDFIKNNMKFIEKR